MREVSTIGIDIAKSVFQVHGINAVGDVVIRRKLRRSEVGEFFKRLPACLIGIDVNRHAILALTQFWWSEAYPGPNTRA